MFKQNDKWGAINKGGKVIIEPNYAYQQVQTILQNKSEK